MPEQVHQKSDESGERCGPAPLSINQDRASAFGDTQLAQGRCHILCGGGGLY